MSRRDDRVSMRQMLDHAKEACEMAAGFKRADLNTNRMLQLALTRLVEIIGEAASRVSKETRGRFPQIPWSEIVGMRHRLVHGYDVVDLDLLWNTVKVDLPPLIKTLSHILKRGKTP